MTFRLALGTRCRFWFIVSNLLVISHASAAVFVPLQADSALTLGSGVDILQPQQALPGCFKFDPPVQRDAPTSQRYDFFVKAVNSIEEVQRERRRRGSASGSYGSVSASLSAWSNQQNTEKRSGLFVIIEARYTGPRTMAESLTPASTVATLLSEGKAAEIVRRCGTHVATTEHRGQTLRMILNLSDIEQSAKQEIAMQFGAKARFGLGGGKVSGSYASTLTSLANERKLNLVMEGSGTAPALQRVMELFKVKSGDLTAVADALAVLLGTASPGQPQSFVTYGFTMQPISLFTNQVPPLASTDEDMQYLEQLQDMQVMLGAQIAELNQQLSASGNEGDETQRLKSTVQLYRGQLAEIRSAVEKCRWESVGSDTSCEVQAWKWHEAIAKSHAIEVKWTISEAAKGFEVRSRYSAAATLVAHVNGNDVPLDAFKVFPGANQLSLVKASISPSEMQLYSDAPLTLNLTTMLAALAEPQSDEKIQRIQVGCFGAAAYVAPPSSQLGIVLYGMDNPAITIKASRLPTLSPDSICATSPPLPSYGTSVGFGGFGSFALTIMPAGLAPLQMDTPRGKVSLKLQLVDRYGFVTEHMMSKDLAKEMVRLFD
jgi:hypothetical protein